MRSLLAVLFFLGLSHEAFAREMNLGQDRFSTYFGGSFGTSQLGDAGFANSSGSQTKFGQKVPWSSSANFGVAFAFGRFSLQLGGEWLLPRSLSELEGKDAAGTKLLNLRSSVQALVPMANLELNFPLSPSSRWLLGLGGGYAFASLENEYTVTSAGVSAYGIGTNTEKGNGRAPLVQVYGGGEWVFTDNCTIVTTLGYRYLKFSELRAPVDQDSFTGHVSAGGTLKNHDGSNRTLDLGGIFAGVQFRFHF